MKKAVTIPAIMALILLSLLPFTLADNTNLAPMFQGLDSNNVWALGTPWADGNDFVYKDTSITHNGNPSIRIESDLWHDDRADYPYIWTYSVTGGSHIIFKCYLKASSGSASDHNSDYGGVRIGLDLYIDSGHCVAWQWSTYVTYGTDWTLVTLNAYVPSLYTGYSWPDQQYVTGHPTYVFPWIQGTPASEVAIYAADTELYIDPTGQTTPTPTPKPTTTATPHPSDIPIPSKTPSPTTNPLSQNSVLQVGFEYFIKAVCVAGFVFLAIIVVYSATGGKTK